MNQDLTKDDWDEHTHDNIWEREPLLHPLVYVGV